MRKALTPWNLLGLFLFLVGILAYWQGQGGGSPHALPLPQGEATSPNRLPLVLYRPDPPKGFLKETLSLDLAPGETPEGKALGTWAEAVGAPAPKALYRLGQGLVVDLPGTSQRGWTPPGRPSASTAWPTPSWPPSPPRRRSASWWRGRPSPAWPTWT